VPAQAVQEAIARSALYQPVEGFKTSAHNRQMLSQRTRYTIRALQFLADRYGKGPVQLAEISESQNIPLKFLTVLLSEMNREGFVASQRGREGGYWLARDPIDVRIGDLVRITRGSLALVPCASRNAYKECRNCVPEDECRMREIMLRLRDETARILDGITLADRTITSQISSGPESA